ncbi:hypothetical protein [Burkholderia contaminans]|uniref:hypothetical protein n=1 Tax=Burkholderia contaminans TaxID=488447 RepID=UPI0015825D76|nr:hypothetical protein [Burkholderia contaminans]MCA8154283.1 hypothetical protein [Burkholderia contaminans]
MFDEFFACSAKHWIGRQCAESVLLGSHRAEVLAHWPTFAADDFNPLARETFSFANPHFQARRLFPEQGGAPIGKKSSVKLNSHMAGLYT